MTFDRPLALRLLGISVFSTAAAFAAGVATAAASFAVLFPAPREDAGFESLGAAIVAAGIGLIVGLVVYAAVATTGVRRVVPEGRRLRTLFAMAPAPFAVGMGLGPLADAAGYGAAAPFCLAAGLAWTAVVAAGVLWAGGAADRATALRAGTAALVVAGVLGLAATMIGSAAERDELVDDYRRSGVPVALVDGRSLESPFAGWSLGYVSDPGYVDRAEVNWHIGTERHVGLELTTEPPLSCAAPWRCQPLGETAQGTLWGRGQGDQPGYEEVWVETATGRWSMATGTASATMQEAVALLERLQPVDAERFVDAAHG